MDQDEFNLHDQQLQIFIIDLDKGIYPERIGKWKASQYYISNYGLEIEIVSIDLVKCENYDEELLQYWKNRSVNEELVQFTMDNTLCYDDTEVILKG